MASANFHVMTGYVTSAHFAIANDMYNKVLLGLLAILIVQPMMQTHVQQDICQPGSK